jgi:cold shock CspA family protein
MDSFEKFTLHALEAHLRGDKWREALLPFLRTNCPRFRNFSTICTFDKKSTASEADLQMHTVYIEFQDLVELELQKVVLGLSTSEERLSRLLDSGLNAEDETINRLHSTLSAYRDFMSFGAMMQHTCEELYPTRPPEVRAHAVKPLQMCRVLWDLENVHVDPAHGGIQTVLALNEYLKSCHLLGPGIDTRITAFFNPFNRSISKKVIEELNKASVELVCASAKREDADRKLGMRINQEMQILIPEFTTFVIISSDQDFRQHIQLLSNAGYRTIVVHEARHESWRSALEMHASSSVEWSTVLKYLPTHPVEEGESPEARIAQKVSAGAKKAKGDIDSGREPDAPPAGAGEKLRDASLEAAAVGWRVAVCQRWSSAFGFLLVDVTHPEVDGSFALDSAAQAGDPRYRINRPKNRRGKGLSAGGNSGDAPQEVPGVGNPTQPPDISTIQRVYVHHSALSHKPAGQRMLSAGEYVLAQVVLEEKGPRAAVVRSLFRSALTGDTAAQPPPP